MQLVRQPVDLRVRRLDLALDHVLVLRQPGSGSSFVQVEYALDQRHHVRVPGGVCGIAESVKAGPGVEELVCLTIICPSEHAARKTSKPLKYIFAELSSILLTLRPSPALHRTG